jgi:hypothetical protein
VAKKSFVLLLAVLAPAILSAQVMDQVPGGSEPDLKTPLVRSALTCSSSTTTFVVPTPLIERAKLKARLVTLLRESLYDDAKGIVNIAREKEIKKLHLSNWASECNAR